jgi:hypothetical protein
MSHPTISLKTVSRILTAKEFYILLTVTAIAWAEKGIQPRDVGDGGFKFAKIGSSGSFFNWGLIELGPDQMKRTKNSRYMHMVFNVQSGTVEVRMHENEFTVHKQGVWQVPRGTLLSLHSLFFALFTPVISITH